MATQHLLNSPHAVVTEALEGLLYANPHLGRIDAFPEVKVVVDTRRDRGCVAVISGGGSGHEPAMAGFVGGGMLAAAVCGDVFASPAEDAVLAAIRAVCGPAGALLVLMNYTGDRLNFGAAAERAKAEGLAVEVVTVQDDALPAPAAGRRGIAGTVLVLKVAGAAAAQGLPLAEVKAAAERAAAAVSTMGCSLSACTLPGQAPSGRIGAGEMELGLGIHGEPGAAQGPLRPADEVVAQLLAQITESSEGGGLPLQAGERVALLVNNLGAATALEMGVVCRAAVRWLTGPGRPGGAGFALRRVWVGAFMTSLDMKGVSLSVMRLGPDSALEAALDAPTQAPAWPHSSGEFRERALLPLPTGSTDFMAGPGALAAAGGDASGPGAAALRRCLEAACSALEGSAEELNALDARVGDGDCGSTLAQGAAAVRLHLDALHLASPPATCLALASIVGRAMGGTSGAVYRIFLLAAAASLQEGPPGALTLASAAAALLAGAAAVSKHGGAARGSRTMLDALLPAADALQAAAQAGTGAADAACAAALAARAGAEATRGMSASAGRSSYVPEEALRDVPDPGAVAVARWVAAVAGVL